MDEFSKESLKIRVERSIASGHVLEALSELFAEEKMTFSCKNEAVYQIV
jgi:hypothetical protein